MSTNHARQMIARFDIAREAGLSVASAIRWAHYRQMKRNRGEQPITIWEAVEQKRHAERRVRA